MQQGLHELLSEGRDFDSTAACAGALAAGLCSVAASRAGAHGPVTVEERPLAEIVAGAIGALKLRAGVELLDRKMATLRQDISERAASAAKDFKAIFEPAVWPFATCVSEPPTRMVGNAALTPEKRQCPHMTLS